MIYFDNAATTAMSQVALQALIEVSQYNYGNPSSAYGYGRRAKEILEEARRIIANCIGALPEEIYFTSCGTESDNWAISQATTSGVKRIITSQIEHHAVLHPVQQYEGSDISVIYIPVDDQGIVSKEILTEYLDGSRLLVSIMLQNNEIGTIQQIEEMAKVIHDDNERSIFHTDAVQAVGHIAIDVNQLGVDMLSASAHKFNGPKGVGFLYIRKDCIFSPFILGGGQEYGMRSGTENVAGIYSMAKALKENVDNIESNHKHINFLEEKFITGLSKEGIKYVINADSVQRAVGVLNIAIEGVDGEGLQNMLDIHDICISVGSACNSKSQDRSHVLKAIGLDNARIDSSIRISIGRYNTEDDIKELLNCIKRCYRLAILSQA